MAISIKSSLFNIGSFTVFILECFPVQVFLSTPDSSCWKKCHFIICLWFILMQCCFSSQSCMYCCSAPLWDNTVFTIIRTTLNFSTPLEWEKAITSISANSPFKTCHSSSTSIIVSYADIKVYISVKLGSSVILISHAAAFFLVQLFNNSTITRCLISMCHWVFILYRLLGGTTSGYINSYNSSGHWLDTVLASVSKLAG